MLRMDHNSFSLFPMLIVTQHLNATNFPPIIGFPLVGCYQNTCEQTRHGLGNMTATWPVVFKSQENVPTQ